MKKNKEGNGNISCDVETCKHNNCEDGMCELESIQVTCTCNNDECECTESTVCDSFECSMKTNKDRRVSCFFYINLSSILSPISGVSRSKLSAIVAPISAKVFNTGNLLGSENALL